MERARTVGALARRYTLGEFTKSYRHIRTVQGGASSGTAQFDCAYTILGMPAVTSDHTGQTSVVSVGEPLPEPLPGRTVGEIPKYPQSTIHNPLVQPYLRFTRPRSSWPPVASLRALAQRSPPHPSQPGCRSRRLRWQSAGRLPKHSHRKVVDAQYTRPR